MHPQFSAKRFFSRKELFLLIIPLVIEQFLAIAVGFADTIMVSYVGENSVSGVSLVDSINILVIQIFSALATGGAVVAAQYIGRSETTPAAPQNSCLTPRLCFPARLWLFACASENLSSARCSEKSNRRLWRLP